MRAGLGRVLLVVALLMAQQTAFAHQIWHVALGLEQSAATGAAGDSSGKAKTDRLCDLHSALGTVLGALNGGPVVGLGAVPPELPFAAPDLPGAGLAAPVPASRGPPHFLR